MYDLNRCPYTCKKNVYHIPYCKNTLASLPEIDSFKGGQRRQRCFTHLISGQYFEMKGGFSGGVWHS